MAENESSEFKYRVFLSYSHKDRRWARWLQRALETYRLPRHLKRLQAERLGNRLAPVFRDRSDLSSAASLSQAVHDALQSSESMVVICSPTAARSEWVNEEIRMFSQLGRADRIFCLIIAGEPGSAGELECFPPALQTSLGSDAPAGRHAAEPLAADARPEGDGRKLARLKLIAGLLNIDFDQLKQRDLQRRYHRLLAITAGSLLIATFTVALAIVAFLANAEAERRRAQAEDLVGFMLGDLQQGLHEIGRLDLFMRVGNKAMEYFTSLKDEEVNDQVLNQRSRALRQIGNARLSQGDTAEALESLNESLAIAKKLAERNPENLQWQVDLANSYFFVGYVHWQRDELNQAQAVFKTILPIVDAVSAQDPENTEWLAERGYAYTNLGRVLELQGQLDQALDVYLEVQAINDRMLRLDPDNVEYQLEVGFSHNNLGKLVMSLGRLSEAQTHFSTDLAIKRAIVEANPNNNLWKNNLATSYDYQARVLIAQGELEQARKHLDTAIEITSRLLMVDPDNSDWLSRMSTYHRELAGIDRREGRTEQAIEHIQAAMEILEKLLKIDSTVALWRREKALCDLESAQLSSLANYHPMAIRQAKTAHEELTHLWQNASTNLENRKQQIFSKWIYGKVLAEAGDADTARNYWSEALELLDSDFPDNRNPELMELRAALYSKLGMSMQAQPIYETLQKMGYEAQYH